MRIGFLAVFVFVACGEGSVAPVTEPPVPRGYLLFGMSEPAGRALYAIHPDTDHLMTVDTGNPFDAEWSPDGENLTWVYPDQGP
jgi:hypothetical protein